MRLAARLLTPLATFLSVGTSVFGFVYFNITGWLIERLTVTAV